MPNTNSNDKFNFNFSINSKKWFTRSSEVQWHTNSEPQYSAKIFLWVEEWNDIYPFYCFFTCWVDVSSNWKLKSAMDVFSQFFKNIRCYTKLDHVLGFCFWLSVSTSNIGIAKNTFETIIIIVSRTKTSVVIYKIQVFRLKHYLSFRCLSITILRL